MVYLAGDLGATPDTRAVFNDSGITAGLYSRTTVSE